MIDIVDPIIAIAHPMISNLWTLYFLTRRHPTMTGPLKFTKITLWLMRVYFPAKIAQNCCREIANAAMIILSKFFRSLMQAIILNSLLCLYACKRPKIAMKGSIPVTLQLTLSIGFCKSRLTPRGTNAAPLRITVVNSKYPSHSLVPSAFTRFSYISIIVVCSNWDFASLCF